MSVRPIPGQPGHFVDNATGEITVFTNAREGNRYDTDQLAAGQMVAGQKLTFFKNVANKEELDTNIPEANKLVTGAEQLLIDRVGVSIQASNSSLFATAKDVARIMCAGFLEITFNGHIVIQGPLEMFPSGYGMSGMTNESGHAVVNIGVPSAAAIQPLLEKQLATSKHTVKAEIRFPARTWLSTSDMPTTDSQQAVRLYCHGLIEAAATNN